MGSWNPNANGTVGLEWLVDQTPTTFLLDSSSRSYALTMPGAAGSIAQTVAPYAQAVSGSGVYGIDVYSSPLIAAVSTTTDTNYPGTDTGFDMSSPLNGGNAWVTNSGATATYAAVNPGVDEVTYLRNVNAFEWPGAWMMFRGANATQMAGKRVLSVEVHARVHANMSGPPLFSGYLRIGGVNYPGLVNVAAPFPYTDLTLGTWQVNPATGAPWTLAAVNNIITSGATDMFGLRAAWLWQAADLVRISSLYLKVVWQPEDRIGYASGTVTAPGWQSWSAKSTPNLLTKQDSNLDTNTGTTGSWTANANTTLSNDGTTHKTGWTRALKMLSVAAGAFGATSGLYPVIPGKTYSAAAYINATAGITTTLSMQFVDANGTTLSTVTSPGVVGSGGYSAVNSVPITTAPATAANVRIVISTTATAGAQTCYAENIFLSLDRVASNLVFDVSAGGLTGAKVDGGAELSQISHASPEISVIHRTSGTGTMSIPVIPAGSSPVGMPQAMTSSRPTLQDAAGAISATSSTTTDTTPLIYTLVTSLLSTNGPDTNYSQVYAQRIAGQVDTTNTVKSELTLPAATYRLVRFVVAAAVDPPNAALLVKLKKVSDNSQVGGTGTVNPTDLAQVTAVGYPTASRLTPQIVTVKLASDAVTGAAQHYVEFSSTATSGSGWYVYALDDMGYTGDSVSADTIGFNGTTDAWNDPLNGGRQTRRDGMVTIQTLPSTPAGLTALAVNP